MKVIISILKIGNLMCAAYFAFKKEYSRSNNHILITLMLETV